MVAMAVLSIVALALIARICHKTWLHPGPFVLLYWSTICVATALFAPDYKLHPLSLLWLFLSLLCQYLGSITGGASLPCIPLSTVGRDGVDIAVAINGLKRNVKAIAASTVFFSLCGILSIFVLAVWVKGSIGVLFSVDGLLSLSYELANMRYGGNEYHQPLSYSVLSYGIFAGALFGGLLYRIADTKRQVLVSLIPFAVALMNAVVKTQRGTIILSIFLWFSAYSAAKALVDRGRIVIFSLKNILRLGALLMVFFVAYVGLQATREGETGTQFVELAILNFKSAALGSLPAFSFWANDTFFDGFEITLGEFSFNRVAYYIFGIPSRQPGMFGDVIWLGDTYREGTTIFTIFRALMQDFSSIGALAALFFVGMIGGYAFRLVRRGRFRMIPFLAMYYAYVLIGYLASMFSWNGIIAAFTVFIGYWVFAKRRHFVRNVRGEIYGH